MDKSKDNKKLWFNVTMKETEKIVNLNAELTSNLKNLEHDELKEFIGYLKDASKIERISNGLPKKVSASKGVLSFLDQEFKILVNRFQNCDIEVLDAILEILRFLRNCMSDLESQRYILEKTIILNNADIFFSKIIQQNIKHVVLKILLQFLINLVSSNKYAAEKVYTIFYDKVKKCLQTNINTYESSALIYYISLLRPINDVELTNTILNLYCSNSENEFLTFFLENNISNDNFWTAYENINIENKTTVLEILKNIQLQKRFCRIPLNAQEILVDDFLKFAGTIFYMSEKEENRLKAYEVSLLLEILSSLSSNENYLTRIQNNKNILISAGVLLININKLGKESENCFTPVQKLTKFGLNSDLNEHPAFGFKADLVRLIGNLCWRNEEMQNLARTAELIPVILDCCNMDARNPFIMQWSIFAIRNICENNKENQKIIHNLHQEGTVSSEVLNDMGITLHSDGSDIKIIPLESLQNN